MESNNRRYRGQILHMLRESGSDGISLDGLASTFRYAGKPSAADRIGELVDYLRDKGYVRVELLRDPITGIRRQVVRITAAGVDLLEGSIDEDPGVVRVR